MHPLEQQAAANPDCLALRAGSEKWSYGRLFAEASAMASYLHGRYGIDRGARVATIAGNSAQHVVAIHAVLLLGAACIPLNTRLSPVEHRSQLDLLRPALLLVESPGEVEYRVPTALLGQMRDTEVLEGFSAAEITDQDILSVMFTSGTTSLPKAVPHSWAQHRASAEGSRGNIGSRPDDAWLCVIPLYHIGGLAILLRSMFYGTAMILPEAQDAESLALELRGGATLASFVPTVLHRILLADPELNREACSELRAILLGGAAASPRLWNEIGERRLPVLGTYGMTETCSQICTVPISKVTEYAGTAGLPIAGAELRIVDEAGESCPAHSMGEILVRGAMVMSGYLENPLANAGSFVDGWFRTGDVGLIDENGALSVLGRRDEVVISGGENIHPSEIEAVLQMHPQVSGAIVVGVPDEEWGQRLAALVSGETIGEKELMLWCRDRLGPLKTPRLWKFVGEIPRTASGKPSRAAARALFTNK